MCGVRFRHQQDATGEPVEAVHNTRTQIAANLRKRLEAVQKRVHDRAAVNPGADVNHHSGGFVDGNHTVGQILFNSPNSYNISQGKAISIAIFRSERTE